MIIVFSGHHLVNQQQQHNNMQNNSGAPHSNSQQLQQERHSQINHQSSESVNNVRMDGNPKKRMLSQQHQMVRKISNNQRLF